MGEAELEKLHAKMDQMLENTAEMNVRLSVMEALAEAKDGRCEAHANSIHTLETTVKGNGKPGLITAVTELAGKMNTLAAIMQERFSGLNKEIAIYVVIGSAITSALMTIAIAFIAARMPQDARYTAKTIEPTHHVIETTGGQK